jgi:pyruvate-formate lyase
MLKALEVTLFNGHELHHGGEMGLKLGSLPHFKTFDELYDAYKRQFRYYAEIMAQQEQMEYEFMAKSAAFLYFSMLYEDCLERGRSIFDGGIRYLGGTLETYGNTNTANSLFAIKKAVYEERKIDRQILLDALKANFEGYEEVRKILLGVDKFGNDLDEVDCFAADLHRWTCETVRAQRERTTLHSYLVVVINNEANTLLGRLTGASADGRRSGEPMANANNPMNGTDRNGITAMLNSLVRLDTHVHAGSVQNLKFSRELFYDHRDVLNSILKTYFKNGGSQAMITVVNKEDLERAMKNPEQYSQLMVRVGGFSARFVTLSKDVQLEIASRTIY